MRRVATHLGWSISFLLTRRLTLAGIAALLVLTLAQVHSRAHDAPYQFGSVDGLAAAVELLRLYLPVLVVLIAAVWVGEQLRRSRTPDAYLADLDPRRTCLTGTAAAAAIGILIAALTLGAALVAGSAWGHEARPIAGVGFVDFEGAHFEPRFLLLGISIVLWALIGGALGVIARSATSSAALTGFFLIASLAVERTATSYPVMADAAELTPLGSTTAAVLGTTVPGMAPSKEPALVSALVMLAWGAAALTMVVRAHWSRLLDRDEPTAQHGRASSMRLPVIATLLLAVVVIGYLAPPLLADRVPWRLKADWRELVVTKRTPADQVRLTLSATVRGDRSAVRQAAVEEVVPTLLALRPQLQAAEGKVRVFDLLDADQPGSVVVDIGADEVQGDGVIVPAPQIGLCLEQRHGTWIITSVSDSGLTCE